MPLKMGLFRSRWNTIFPWEPRIVSDIDELKSFYGSLKASSRAGLFKGQLLSK